MEIGELKHAIPVESVGQVGKFNLHLLYLVAGAINQRTPPHSQKYSYRGHRSYNVHGLPTLSAPQSRNEADETYYTENVFGEIDREVGIEHPHHGKQHCIAAASPRQRYGDDDEDDEEQRAQA